MKISGKRILIGPVAAWIMKAIVNDGGWHDLEYAVNSIARANHKGMPLLYLLGEMHFDFFVTHETDESDRIESATIMGEIYANGFQICETESPKEEETYRQDSIRITINMPESLRQLHQQKINDGTMQLSTLIEIPDFIDITMRDDPYRSSDEGLCFKGRSTAASTNWTSISRQWRLKNSKGD